MFLTLETTTGLLVPDGEAPRLPRGGVEQILVRFVTNGVAALLANGAPIALNIYRASDLETPIATVDEFTTLASDLAYQGSLDTLAAGLAGIERGTFRGRISYKTINVDSEWFQLVFGDRAAASGTPIQEIIVREGSAAKLVEVIGQFAGLVVVNQVEGFLKVQEDCSLVGLQLTAQVAPTGADLVVDVVKNNAAQNKTAKITAAAKGEETLFGSALALVAGDVLKFKPTQVGSGTPGSYLTVKAIINL